MRTSIYEINLKLEIHIYIDASEFVADYVITQFRSVKIINVEDSSKDAKVSLLYNLFIFSTSQRKYSTYKRKLCVIVTFCRKYDYVYKYSFKLTVVYINYKSLTHFLRSDLHKDIYRNWADHLRRLNIFI